MSWSSLISRLPQVRGKYVENAPLADVTWLRVGGPAQVLYLPADEADLGRRPGGDRHAAELDPRVIAEEEEREEVVGVPGLHVPNDR